MTNHFNEILPFHCMKVTLTITPIPVHSEKLFFNRLSLQPTMTPSLSPVLPGFHLTQTVLYNGNSKPNVDVLLETISPPPPFSLSFLGCPGWILTTRLRETVGNWLADFCVPYRINELCCILVLILDAELWHKHRFTMDWREVCHSVLVTRLV